MTDLIDRTLLTSPEDLGLQNELGPCTDILPFNKECCVCRCGILATPPEPPLAS